jgi:AcrR family transcriptional regulator
VRINPEKKEDRERVARELLRVTLRLASEHGFVSLGLREVSRAAEIAPTSFYRYFSDMEELGRALIDGLAGPFIERWIGPATATGGESRVVAIAAEALAETGRDPELMRFILAEQHGAIPGFRKALATKLTSVSDAVKDAIAAEVPGEGPAPEQAARAIVLLILGSCADLLDQGPGRSAAISGRLVTQIHWLLAGAGLKEKR